MRIWPDGSSTLAVILMLQPLRIKGGSPGFGNRSSSTFEGSTPKVLDRHQPEQHVECPGRQRLARRPDRGHLPQERRPDQPGHTVARAFGKRFGLSIPYAIDAISCLGIAGTAAAFSLQPTDPGVVHERGLRSIRTGFAFVRRQQPVLAGFVIDLSAITFGMPRALFSVLSLTVY